MTRKNSFFSKVISGALLSLTLAVIPVNAALEFIPVGFPSIGQDDFVNISGEEVKFNITLSDFGDNGVSGFLFGVKFDPTLLEVTTLVPTTDLGELFPEIGMAASYFTLNEVNGTVTLEAYSNLPSPDLLAFQDGKTEIILATIGFKGIGVGDTKLEFFKDDGYPALMNAEYEELAFEPRARSVSVPEPSLLSLLALGLTSLLALRGNRRQLRRR